MNLPTQIQGLKKGVIVFNTQRICPQSCTDLKPFNLFDTKFSENVLIDVGTPIKIIIGEFYFHLENGQYVLPGELFTHPMICIPFNVHVHMYIGYKIDPRLEQLSKHFNIFLYGIQINRCPYTNKQYDGYYVPVVIPKYYCDPIYCSDSNTMLDSIIHSFNKSLDDYVNCNCNFTIESECFVNQKNVLIDELCVDGVITFCEC